VVIDIDKLAKYVVLREDGIVSIKYGDRKNPATNRTIVAVKKKQSNRNFFNQVTILMKPTNNINKNYINIKVFNNGSVQATGCTDIDDFNNVINTLIGILKKGQDIKNKNNKIRHIRYIDNKKDIGIHNSKIRMINSNFKLEYKIDRKKLAFLLKKYHGNRTTDTEIGYVEFKHKPNGGHSCVNIKYNCDENSRPSIFVFQTGAVIITGAKNLYQIISAYHYIYLILNKYSAQIKIVELNPALVNAEIELFCKERQKNQLCLDARQFDLDLTETNKFNESDKQKRPNKPTKSTKSQKTSKSNNIKNTVHSKDDDNLSTKSKKKPVPSKDDNPNKSSKSNKSNKSTNHNLSDSDEFLYSLSNFTESTSNKKLSVSNKPKKSNVDKKIIITV